MCRIQVNIIVSYNSYKAKLLYNYVCCNNYKVSFYAPKMARKPRKIPTIITLQEYELLHEKTKNPKHRLAFALGFFQCMRVSEVVKLKPEDVDIKSNLIYIKQSKGSKDRNIALSPKITEKLLKNIPVGCGIRALQIAFKRKAKAVLDKNIHFHTLRHSGASYYLNERNWDIRFLQVFLGHEDIGTTQIYTHVNPQKLQELMRLE